MNDLIKWCFWIIIILLVIWFFPKSCALDNENIKTTCIGITLPYDAISNSGEKFEWCSGYCKEDDLNKKISESDLLDEPEDSPSSISFMFKSFKSTLPFLVVIAIVIGVIAGIQSLIGKVKHN
jgi:hypothetical protein